jgi:hypothetical protein
VLATWLGEPLSNLFLRLHPLGRHALSRDERNAASATGVLLLLGVAYLFLFLLFGWIANAVLLRRPG